MSAVMHKAARGNMLFDAKPSHDQQVLIPCLTLTRLVVFAVGLTTAVVTESDERRTALQVAGGIENGLGVRITNAVRGAQHPLGSGMTRRQVLQRSLLP